MTQLGRYEILTQLATGPATNVLLARTRGLEGFTRHVVVKQIRPELASDEQFVAAFLNEARIGASLHHQNIVQVYDVDEDHGAYFIAMEFIHGEDVRKLLRTVHDQNALVPLDQVVTIGAAAAAGLHYAHEKVDASLGALGLVHRAVAPSNILIGFDGSVKLVDFGLAKSTLSSMKTRTGSIAANAPYMSPELCQGKPVDRRSDVFSLGIVLYELATARRLFQGGNDYMTMTSIVEGSVAPPSTHRPDIPGALDEIILHALAKAPEARFQTAADLRVALESFSLERALRTTDKALADYMVRVFGPRAEPWQADAPERQDDAPASPFDGDAVAAVPPSDATGTIRALGDPAIAPIAVARANAKEPESEFEVRTTLDPHGAHDLTLTVAEPAILVEPAGSDMHETLLGLPPARTNATRAPSPRLAAASPAPSRIDAADEATTVRPPAFPIFAPRSAPEPPRIFAPGSAQRRALRPAWIRYLTLALAIAIPLAVGFATRSCARDHAVARTR